MSNTISTRVLSETLWPAEGGNVWSRNIVLAVLGSLAIWVSAKISVPMFPVPMTMQTVAVLSIGAAFGARLGFATVLLYLAEGAMGLPVFTGTPEKGIGLLYMAGSTGGYLFGYLIAAYIVGWLAERGWDRNVFLTALAMLIGSVALYVPGLTWLATPFSGITALVGSEYTGYGFAKAVEWGLTPFILGDLIKIALAAALFPMIWKLIGARRA